MTVVMNVSMVVSTVGLRVEVAAGEMVLFSAVNAGIELEVLDTPSALEL